MSRVDVAAFRAAMARFPGAVTIVTARDGAERRGITATAVCSVSAEPPSLLVCLNRRTGTCAAVQTSGRFAVNLLAGDGGALALAFAGATGATGEAKFATGDWGEDGFGLPLLADAVLGFSCEVAEVIEAGSHCVFIGHIAAVSHGSGPALVYEQSRFHRLTPLG
mgnify:CR=1 FL=1